MHPHESWPMSHPPGRVTRHLLFVWLLVHGPLTHAHDTWFSSLPAAQTGGPTRLALGTGNRYPVLEFNPQAISVAEAGCRSASGRPLALLPDAEAATHLVMRVRNPNDRVAARTCWAQLKPFEVVLSADKVSAYFREIRPSDAVRQAWARLQQRGIPWQERYTKHARIELAPAADVTTAATEPSPLGMDALLLTPPAEVRPGATLAFVVLRDGQPLADFPVELVSERQRFGIWRQTDGQGRVSAPVPFSGRWILRGTDLALSATQPDRWESHFITLAFEVPAPR